MSVPRSTQCLFRRQCASITAKPAASSTSSIPFRRKFHQSTQHLARRRPKYASIKASELEELKAEANRDYAPYTDEQKEILSRKYNKAQMESVKAADKSIDRTELATQAASRDMDPWAVDYMDDMAHIDPVVDHQEKALLDPAVNYEVRPKTEDELLSDMKLPPLPEETQRKLDDVQSDLKQAVKDNSTMDPEFAAIQALYGGGQGLDGLTDFDERVNKIFDSLTDEEAEKADFERLKQIEDPRTFMHAESEEAYRALTDSRYDAFQPELPRLTHKAIQAMANVKKDPEEEEVEPALQRLMLRTGMTRLEIRKLRTKTLVQHRVVNQTRMGKISSMYYLTIAGNGNGMLGVGEGKASEPGEARNQSVLQAIANMKPIPRYENRTIYGEVEGKSGAVRVKVSSRPPGFGNRCQHLIFEMARAAGIDDLAAKVGKSRNKMNVIKATWQALQGQKLPEDIARARGRKLVDVRKVYYGGMVY